MLSMLLIGCQKPVAFRAETMPDCTPMKASVTVQCWSPYERPLEQCEIVKENPPGCNFREQALEFSQSVTLDLANKELTYPGNWVMIEVMRDDQGRVGRPSTHRDGTRYVR